MFFMKSNAISKVTVSGFKSIAEQQTIDIRPLTVLAGINSSGKSSFIQPLLLLKQTLEAVGDPGTLLLDGPNVKFTSTDQVLNKTQTGISCFGVSIEIHDQKKRDIQTDKIELSFCKKNGRGFELLSQKLCYIGQQIDLNLSLDVEEIKNRINLLRTLPFAELTKNPAFHFSVKPSRCFFDIAMYFDDKSQPRMDVECGLPARFVDQIKGFLHLPGLRSSPQRIYQKMGVGDIYPGTFDNYTASVIAKWQEEKAHELEELACMLKHMGLTSNIKAEFLNDVQIELQVGRLLTSNKSDCVCIADVGVGVSQVLPVLVALLAARPGQLVYIEQPEIHLHPRAQHLLADVLCQASNRGVRLVIETHSAILLLALQTLVAKGKIEKEDVVFHWMQRNNEGNTTVTTAELDNNGAYGKWPVDFDDVALETEAAYLDAIEAKGSQP